MGLTIITPPPLEPLDLDTVKAHLRIDGVAEDALLTAMIATARRKAEVVTGRALITRTYQLTLDCWPLTVVRLPYPPALAVTEVAYVDTAGDPQVWDQAEYIVDLDPIDPRLAPAHGQTWPVARDQINAVTVTFTAGYGGAVDDVPEPIRHAMLLIIGDLYANREDDGVDRRAATNLLWLYRVGRF